MDKYIIYIVKGKVNPKFKVYSVYKQIWWGCLLVYQPICSYGTRKEAKQRIYDENQQK